MRSFNVIGIPVFTLLTSIWTTCFTQTDYFNNRPARLQALADQGIALRGIEASTINPAVLGFEDYFTILASASSKYAGSGIREAGLYSGIPISSLHGAFSIGLLYYGIPEFNRFAFSFSYGRKLLSNLSIGSAVEYHSIHIAQQEPSSYTNVVVGTQLDLTPHVRLGLSISKPFTIQDRNTIKSSVGFRFGVAYKISEWVSIYTESEKDKFIPWYFKAAIEYQILPVLSVRMGATTGISSFTSGIGLMLSKTFYVDFATVFYQSLGMSPTLSLKFALNPNSTSE